MGALLGEAGSETEGSPRPPGLLYKPELRSVAERVKYIERRSHSRNLDSPRPLPGVPSPRSGPAGHNSHAPPVDTSLQVTAVLKISILHATYGPRVLLISVSPTSSALLCCDIQCVLYTGKSYTLHVKSVVRFALFQAFPPSCIDTDSAWWSQCLCATITLFACVPLCATASITLAFCSFEPASKGRTECKAPGHSSGCQRCL